MVPAMKKIISLFLLISLCSIGHAQTIRGSVLDLNSHKPVANAIVYINGTFVGTYTDRNGVFELKIPGNLSGPLTVSSIGYFSVDINNINSGMKLLVYLNPKVYQLKEVVITAKKGSRARRTNMAAFKKEFLGSSMNAMNCNIENENDIALYHVTGTDTIKFGSSGTMIITKIDTLKAYSFNPIIINNKALGYKIAYYLDEFEYCFNNNYLYIQGNCIFKEDSLVGNIRQKSIERRRKSAYLGSRMHFLRALWNNELDSAGFTVRDSVNRILTYDRIVGQSDTLPGSEHLKYFNYRGIMSIAYYSKTPRTLLTIEKDNVYFDNDQILVPKGISWAGDMARQRMGDLLPSEYNIR